MGLLGWGRDRRGVDPPTRERFAQEVLRAVHATGRVSSARFDVDDFSIAYRLTGEDNEGRIFLQNTFQETAAVSPTQRAEHIARLVDAVVGARSVKETWAQARPNLRPVLRGVSFGAGTAVGAATLICRPALPFLMEAVVVDRPTSMAYVTRALLADWAVSADEVFATARANLAALVAASAAGAADEPTVLRYVDAGDAYFTSMLLVDGFLAGLAPRVGGRPIAFVPDRDTLIVAADDQSGLAELYALVEEEYREAPRSVTPCAYTVDDRGAVVPFRVPPGSPLAAVVHRSEVVLAAAEYGPQKAALDEAHAKDGVDIFVASLLALGRPDSSVVSVAVWPQDVDTLLPQADVIAFQGVPLDDSDQSVDPTEGAGTLTVPFAVVASEAVLVAEPDYDPPRYRVTAWPPEPIMARLRDHAVPL